MSNDLLLYEELFLLALIEGNGSNSSDIVNVTSPETNETVRIGYIQSLLLQASNELVWRSSDFAALMAVVDFNERRLPYSSLPDDQIFGSCNFHLAFFVEQEPIRRMTDLARAWQDKVLLYCHKWKIRDSPSFFSAYPPRPLGILGGVTSSQSELLATLGAAAARIACHGQSQSALSVRIVENGDIQNDQHERRAQVGSDFLALRYPNEEGVMNISPSSTSSNLDRYSMFPFFARTIPSNKADAEVICQVMKNVFNVQELAVLYVNDNYGSTYVVDLQASAARHGLQIFSYPFAHYNQIKGHQSLNSMLDLLRQTPLRFVFAILPANDWRDTVREISRSGLLEDPDYAFFFSDSASVISPSRATRHTLSGLVTGPLNNTLDEELAKALNRTAFISAETSSNHAAMFRERMREAALNSSYLDYWTWKTQQTNITVVPSLFSMLTYDAVMAMGLAGCKTSNNTMFQSANLYALLTGTQFDGASGTVQFDSTGTRVADNLKYAINNLLTYPISNEGGNSSGAYFVSSVPVFEICLKNNSIEEFRNLTFKSGSTIAPPSIAPVQTNFLLVPLGVRAFLWVLSGLVLLLTLFCAGWTILNRDHPKVRASQPFFLVLVCFGVLLWGISMVMGTLQEPLPKRTLDASCLCSLWFMAVGAAIIFSAIFAKTWRIYRVISNARRFRRVQVKVKDVLWPALILVGLNITILIVWTIVSPLQWYRGPLDIDRFGRVVSSRGGCFSIRDGDRVEALFGFLIVGINLAALLLLNFQSYRSRNLPSEFNEGFYIAITNLIILEDMIIGIPLLFVAGSNPTILMFAKTIVATIFCLAVLLPTFVPKFRKGQDDGKRRFIAHASGENATGSSSATSSLGRLFRLRSATSSSPNASSKSRGAMETIRNGLSGRGD